MPKDKTETYHKIIRAAKVEFLEKGFEQASMRNIASAIGMSAAGLYRHFKDKEDLFDALIEPLMQAFAKAYAAQRKRAYRFLEDDGNMEELWMGKNDLTIFLDLMHRYYDEFRLLLCCADGTKHADFIHDFTSFEQKETLEYMEAARKKGLQVNDIKPQELHLLLSAYYTAVFEVVVHSFDRAEAEHYLDTLQRFFFPGWRAVLGL